MGAFIFVHPYRIMKNDNSVILGLHTPNFAKALVSTLRTAGIAASIEAAPGIDAGSSGESPVAVVVGADVALKAIRVAESGRYFDPSKLDMKLAGMGSSLLIPVDLSSLSIPACRLGFGLAERLGLMPVVMYVYTVPAVLDPPSDSMFPSLTDGMGTVEEMQEEKTVEEIAGKSFSDFVSRLDAAIASGSIPRLKYTTRLQQGVPEEAIISYTRTNNPAMVVMATRGRNRKSVQALGSVTAEVLDSCRVPVFTVPENFANVTVRDITRLCFFCNLDDRDILSLQFLMQMFDFPEVDVLLIPIVKQGAQVKEKLEALRVFLSTNYPMVRFETSVLDAKEKEFRSQFENIVEEKKLQLLVVPNRKTNIFARLFKPGIPHRILFERDIPMLALPV